MLALPHGHDGHGVTWTWTTNTFCEWLEKAVEYMQSPHHNDLPPYPEQQEFVRLVWRAVRAGRLYMLACVVVLFYEYIITLDKEIESVWQRKKSVVSWLFFVNRYLPIATYLFVIPGVAFGNSHDFCVGVFAHLPPAMVVLSEAVIGALHIAKIRALWRYELNVYFSCLVTVVYVSQEILAIMCAVNLQGVGPLFGVEQRIGCFLIFRTGSMPRLILYWFTNILFNILVFVAIMKRSIESHSIAGRELGLGGPGLGRLIHIVQRDATLFLISMCSIKIANLVMLIVFPYWNAVNWLCNHIVDVILTSRLFFNLRAETEGVASNGAEIVTLQIKFPHTDLELPVVPIVSGTNSSRDQVNALEAVIGILEKEGLPVTILSHKSLSFHHRPRRDVEARV